MDIAAPGFEYLAESTANVCGRRDRTWLTRTQSGVCVSPQSAAPDGGSTDENCDCSWTGEARATCGVDDGSPCWFTCCASAAAPSASCCGFIEAAGAPESQRLRAGCELFRAWGWTNGAPTLEYQPVACPADFTAAIATAFTAAGVAPMGPAVHETALPHAPPLPPVSPLPKPWPPPPPSPPPFPPASGLSRGSVVSIVLGSAIALLMYLVWGRCNWTCRRGRAPPRAPLEGPSVLRVRGKRVRGAFSSSSGAMGYRAGCGAPPAAPPGGLERPSVAATCSSCTGSKRGGAVEMVLPEALAESSAPQERVEVV